jgi:hypothetical protein
VALVGVPVFATGGADGRVRLLAVDGSERFSVDPFPGSAGGARTAVADVNGDGTPDLIAGTGPGGPSRVRVFDGADPTRELFRIDPFEGSFTGGVFVAAADVTGDGKADLVITPDQGGGPRVRVISGDGNPIADFLGIDDPNFRGGARTALADLNRDGVADLLVAAGFEGGPRIAGFDGRTLGSANPARLFADFFAFEDSLRNGVFLAAGDLDADGVAEVIAGGGPGGAPRVSAFSGRSLVEDSTAHRIADFFAGDVGSRDGVRLAVKDLDGDDRADLITSVGPTASGQILGYSGKGLTAGHPQPDLGLPALFGAFVG